MGIYKAGKPKRYNVKAGEGNEPPHVMGEYRITDKNNKAYIGITNDLNRRMKEHEKSGKLSDENPFFYWMPAKPGTTYDQMREHERKSILKHNPSLNKRGGGGGCPPKNMYYLEEEIIDIPKPKNRLIKIIIVAILIFIIALVAGFVAWKILPRLF